jgi:hypothetical protein
VTFTTGYKIQAMQFSVACLNEQKIVGNCSSGNE